VRALDRLDLMASPGEIIALLGPSGCGKTTTLRLLAGLVRPDSGSIHIGPREVAGPNSFVPPEQRRVGLVFQHYALFPHLSAADNVAYGLRKHPDPAGRVREMLALAGLGALGHRMPHELSGGQQQRVALARALAIDPDLLLLDEPFSNLDARMRITVREEVRDIIKRSGTTAIFVTHDQEEALFIGDRIAILNGGRLEQIGSPETIYHEPATHFVAEFMGHTGFLPASATIAGIETELGTLRQRIDLPPDASLDVLARPDDVHIAATAEGQGIVRQRVFQGMHNLYRVELPSGRFVDSLVAHTIVIQVGARVRVSLDAGHPLECFVGGKSVGHGRVS